MFCFINLSPQTPPSVIHGWKATDLLYEMVKTEKYFFGPVKRQIFGDALKQTFYMISKLVLKEAYIGTSWSLALKQSFKYFETDKIRTIFSNKLNAMHRTQFWNLSSRWNCKLCQNLKSLKLPKDLWRSSTLETLYCALLQHNYKIHFSFGYILLKWICVQICLFWSEKTFSKESTFGWWISWRAPITGQVMHSIKSLFTSLLSHIRCLS